MRQVILNKAFPNDQHDLDPSFIPFGWSFYNALERMHLQVVEFTLRRGV